MTQEDDVLNFIGSSIKSVWALELLLLLRRDSARGWGSDDLVRELRGSETIISEAVNQLESAGLVALEDGFYTYRPASNDIDRMVGHVDDLYKEKPIAVMKAIMSAPNDKLRVFSDAFKLKD